MSLELWNAQPDLPQDMTRLGEIVEPLWAPIFSMDGGDGARCKVWVLRSDAHTDSPHLKPLDDQRHAIEAEFDGHMEQRLVIGSNYANTIFKEMEAYLKEGYDRVVSTYSSGH